MQANNGPNALHGGLKAFDKAVWSAHADPKEENTVHFALVSKDGENGYPGENKRPNIIFN